MTYIAGKTNARLLVHKTGRAHSPAPGQGASPRRTRGAPGPPGVGPPSDPVRKKGGATTPLAARGAPAVVGFPAPVVGMTSQAAGALSGRYVEPRILGGSERGSGACRFFLLRQEDD